MEEVVLVVVVAVVVVLAAVVGVLAVSVLTVFRVVALDYSQCDALVQLGLTLVSLFLVVSAIFALLNVVLIGRSV